MLALLEGREPVPSRSGRAVGGLEKPGGIVGVPRRDATSLSRPGGMAGVDRRDSWNCGSEDKLGRREGVLKSASGEKSASSSIHVSACIRQMCIPSRMFGARQIDGGSGEYESTSGLERDGDGNSDSDSNSKKRPKEKRILNTSMSLAISQLECCIEEQ